MLLLPKQIHMNKIFFVFSMAGLILAACNTSTVAEVPASFSIDSVKAAITASNAVYEESIRTNDSAKYISRYTADGCINPPNMPKMCGPAALAGFFKGAVGMGIKDLKLTTEEVLGGPDAVSETGTYEMFADGGVSIDKGKFIVIWKQENGAWKMYKDEWNSDNPPPPPPPLAK